MSQVTKIYGPPGTGKTTELLRMMESCEKLGFFAFTKAAAKEARERLGLARNPRMTTLHALCYAELGLAQSQVFDADDLAEFSRLTGIPCEGKNTWGAESVAPGDVALEAIHRARAQCLCPWEVACEEPQGFVRNVAEQYTAFKDQRGLLDFDDMLERFLDTHSGNLGITDLFVDEGQDLSPLQWRVVAHVAKHVPRVVLAGDDDQCQPGETTVDTPRGPRRIDSLAAGDMVTGWHRAKHHFGPCRVRVAARHYIGRMASVISGGHFTRATMDHHWVIRWARDLSTCVTYMMRKGEHYRVGWCQLHRADGCLHLNVRANCERADAVWVVGVHADRTDASVAESIISAKFGIPTMPFRPVTGARHITQEAIDRVFAGVDSQAGALRLAEDRGLSLSDPLIDRVSPNFSRGGSKEMVVSSRNLLPGAMLIPVRADATVVWERFAVHVAEVSEPVYSLDVEGAHTYVADGVVTHNCIYTWAGADPLGMTKWGGEDRVLGQSWRIPKVVHNLAHEIVDRIPDRVEKVYRPREEEGEIRRYGDLTYCPSPRGSTLVLFRNHGARAEVINWLTVEHPTPFLGEGSPFQSRWAVAARAWLRLQRGEEIDKAQLQTISRCAPEVGKMVAAGDMSWVKHDPYAVMDAMPPLSRWYLRQMDLEVAPTVKISTIHASKGAKADRVVLLAAMGERTWADADVNEHRVWYVGVTRARHLLDIIDGGNAYAI